jgi:hypothetical protein
MTEMRTRRPRVKDVSGLVLAFIIFKNDSIDQVDHEDEPIF